MRSIRVKTGCLCLCLVFFSGAICAEQTDSCAGLAGSALNQCRSNEQTLRQEERLEQMLQQQQERQNQLDKQQREVQQQLESMRLQNESLRKELERETANQRTRPASADAADAAKNAEVKNAAVKSWKADNPWFGSDYVKTQFAMRYVKQLQQEHPDLAGRELLDALSTKVNATFGANH
jgi:TolA-binding protein